VVLIHVEDTVSQKVGEIVVVGGDDHGFAGFLKSLKEVDEPVLGAAVEAGKRFIEDENLGVHREHSRECNPLFFASAELIWRAICETLDINHFHEVVYALVDNVRRKTHLSRAERNLIANVVAEQLNIWVLEDKADALVEVLGGAAVAEACFGHRLAIEKILALLRENESVKELEESRFAAAVGALEGNGLAFVYIKIDVTQRDDVVVSKAYVVELD